METFHAILQGALQSGASDIHLKVDGPVMYRVGRELRRVEAPTPTEAWLAGVLREIVPPHLQAKLAETHEVDFALALPGQGRFRVNVYQQRGQYSVALRSVRTAVQSAEQLHLPPIIPQLAESRRGIVLITGAPGAGKSTTLAAMLHHLNASKRQHIVTLEDPIEYYFEDDQCVIEQREVGLDTMTFRSGLHHVLRQDPDVLVIGEMRDGASAQAAVSAANVGTLVLSTLHTSDAGRSIQRILEFFPGEEREVARHQLATTLRAVVSQRLVRTLRGGVVPAMEVMVNTRGVAKLIEQNRLDQLGAAIELGEGDGMISFERSLTMLLHSGTISQEEAMLHAPNAESFRMRLQGVVLTESKRIIGSRT